MKQPAITNFNQQRVWIIGASSGIGEACAKALLRQNARVALSSRRVERLEAIAAEFNPSNYLILPVDVTKTNQIEKAKDAYQKALLYAPDFTDAKEALDKLK